MIKTGKGRTAKRITIGDVKNIGIGRGYSHVIVTAYDKTTGISSVQTWGKNPLDNTEAEKCGKIIKKVLGFKEQKEEK